MAAQAATDIHHLHAKDRERVRVTQPSATTIHVYEQFCREPLLTNAILVERLNSTKPTIQKALEALVDIGLLQEVSGKKRGRRYAYQKYLDILTRDTTTKMG
jgi:predicted transcriptional regulator